MYSKASDDQGRLFGDYIYENLIPKDHLLRRIDGLVDFSFVEQETKALYSKTGRPGISPVLLFKMLVIGFLYNVSDRRLEDEVRYNIAYKWFVGLDVDEAPPDHSSLTRFRDRLGAETFHVLFNRIVDMARDKGLIHDRLAIIDATHVVANVDVSRLKKHKRDDADQDYVDRNSPDKDARFGRKSKTKGFYGYKDHIAMDADSSIVTAVETTPGNVPDCKVFSQLISGAPETVSADKGYDSTSNRKALRDIGVKDAIIPVRRGPGRPPHAERQRSWVERKFGEAKLYHGKRQCRWLGLAKAEIQALLTFTVINLKAMAKALTMPPAVDSA